MRSVATAAAANANRRVLMGFDVDGLKMLQRAGVAASTGYMGDDVVDLPILRACGFSAAVADAHDEVLSRVDHVASKSGGRGVVREVCVLILRAQGKWNATMAEYLA